LEISILEKRQLVTIRIMQIEKTTFEKIKALRTSYLSSLPEFQELFLELMIGDSDYYLLQLENKVMGYAIRNCEGILIEFYVIDRYVRISHEFFKQVIKDLAIQVVYCKSFDSLLLSNCLLSSCSYSLVGVLYRDYTEPQIQIDPEMLMQQADLSSVNLLMNQDDSIKELFETEQQLTDFIQNEHVFEFYKNSELVGCGMVLRTNVEWDYCDLGVWVHPQKRGKSMGAQIIIQLREFALQNQMKPSCGCAIENLASQKTIEKSGFVSKHKLISFTIDIPGV
jgi:predicted acetyltransferase